MSVAKKISPAIHQRSPWTVNLVNGIAEAVGCTSDLLKDAPQEIAVVVLIHTRKQLSGAVLTAYQIETVETVASNLGTTNTSLKRGVNEMKMPYPVLHHLQTSSTPLTVSADPMNRALSPATNETVHALA